MVSKLWWAIIMLGFVGGGGWYVWGPIDDRSPRALSRAYSALSRDFSAENVFRLAHVLAEQQEYQQSADYFNMLVQQNPQEKRYRVRFDGVLTILYNREIELSSPQRAILLAGQGCSLWQGRDSGKAQRWLSLREQASQLWVEEAGDDMLLAAERVIELAAIPLSPLVAFTKDWKNESWVALEPLLEQQLKDSVRDQNWPLAARLCEVLRSFNSRNVTFLSLGAKVYEQRILQLRKLETQSREDSIELTRSARRLLRLAPRNAVALEELGAQ